LKRAEKVLALVNNFMSITANVTTAEAPLLAEASGLDPELARKVMLGTTAGQGHMATTYPAKVLRNDLLPGFMVDLAHKDLGLGLELASQLGVAMPTGTAAKPIYDLVRSGGQGRRHVMQRHAIKRNAAAVENLGRCRHGDIAGRVAHLGLRSETVRADNAPMPSAMPY
jgi:4-hydroxybutyrate dehydrogenase/sulfolactaldehyde 3-reductase